MRRTLPAVWPRLGQAWLSPVHWLVPEGALSCPDTHTQTQSHIHTQMLNSAFSPQQQESDLRHHCHFSSDTRQLSDEHRHPGASVLPSDWLLVHQCSKVPANTNTTLNKPPTRLRLFSFCPSCTAMLMWMIVKKKNCFVVNCLEKLCVYVKAVYLFVWSRANCNLQLCKTLLQLCNLQRRNRVNSNAPSDPHTHTSSHTFPASPPFISKPLISLMREQGNVWGNKCEWSRRRRSSSLPWQTRWISPARACCEARTEPLRLDL